MTVHTIKVSAFEAIRVEPEGEGVKLSAMLAGQVVGSRVASLDLVGALLFAMEQAAEEAEQNRQLARATERAGRAAA